MTDEIIIVNSNLHESNASTNTTMTSFMSPSTPLLSTRSLSTEQHLPINKNNSNNVEQLRLLHDSPQFDVDENIIKTQNNISNKDDVEVAISNSHNCNINNNNSQKLLIDSSHQLLPSQPPLLLLPPTTTLQQQQQQLTRSNLVNLTAYQSVSHNCIKQDLPTNCAINNDKLAENQLFAYENKCLSSFAPPVTKYKCNSKKIEHAGCKKLINFRKLSKSDTCLNVKKGSHDAYWQHNITTATTISNDHIAGELHALFFFSSRTGCK